MRLSCFSAGEQFAIENGSDPDAPALALLRGFAESVSAYDNLDEAIMDSSIRVCTGQTRMLESIHTDEYAALLALLRETRRDANLTQVELAARLGQSQSFVSKMEVGERRLDLVQLRTVCVALGTTLPLFVQKLEDRLQSEPKGRFRTPSPRTPRT